MDINLTKEIESVVTDLKSNLFKMVKELDKKIRLFSTIKTCS